MTAQTTIECRGSQRRNLSSSSTRWPATTLSFTNRVWSARRQTGWRACRAQARPRYSWLIGQHISLDSKHARRSNSTPTRGLSGTQEQPHEPQVLLRTADFKARQLSVLQNTSGALLPL